LKPPVVHPHGGPADTVSLDGTAVRIAESLTRRRGGRLRITRFEHVPDQVTLGSAVESVPDRLARDLDSTVLLVHSRRPRSRRFLRYLLERLAFRAGTAEGQRLARRPVQGFT
jgi:hypothetical protein